PRLADPRTGRRLLLWLGQSRIVALVPHGVRAARVRPAAVAPVSRGEPALRGSRAGRSRRRTGAGFHSGLSLRPAAAHSEGAQPEPGRGAVLAHSVAQ